MTIYATDEHARRSLSRRVLDPAQRLAAMSAEEGDCLVWLGRVDGDGYGKMRVHGGHPVRVHRLAWTLAHGPIPDGLVVRHRCDNPRCVSLDHLELGTTADNNRDRDERGRASVGASHYAAKLTPDQVRDIRARTQSGEGTVAVAREYGVRPWTVQKIRDGKTWRSVA